MNFTLLAEPPPPQASPLLFRTNFPIRLRQFRPCRRNRHKPAARSLVICTGLLDPFQSFLTQFPSSNSLDLLTPAIGLASGLTIYLYRLKPKDKPGGGAPCDIGEWILFTSPTPFNRFVVLRCPSISFEGSDLLEGVNEKLVEQDTHFVRLNSGRVHVKSGEEIGDGGSLVDKLDYQRVCVSMDDGGVVSLDWPANLNFDEEHGLDTTVLLVPGTPDGSTDQGVRSFVCEALGRGFFPIVMNPRGCAGSPLTTARLFSAADSDDISTVIQFTNKARPWTTLMAVGWGYGANMLTKYLGEVGDKTPLTAATCINNPFDLEEVSRSSPSRVALDQKLTGGLIDMLRANQGLFQGKSKGFDVEKALVAKSLCDFEKAISMVSYGCKELKEFYSNSSTASLVKHVKVPVLFIQNDDGTVPLFSIPRSSIAENPFTNLLLCSCSPSGAKTNSRAALSWCQNLTIEWLSAVELGLLKGRHPLLTDLDVTINVSKGLTLSEGAVVDIDDKDNEPVDLTLSGSNGRAVSLSNELVEGSSTGDLLNLGSAQSCDEDSNIKNGLQEAEGQLGQRTGEAEILEDDSACPTDDEKGEVLQTANVVMNMLDVAMPGVLAGDERKKVLTAVDQGETLLKALEDAVPEDVRTKLTTAASGILQANRMRLKLGGLPGTSDVKMPNVSELKSNALGDPISHSTPAGPPTDQMNKTNSSTHDVGDDQSGVAIGINESGNDHINDGATGENPSFNEDKIPESSVKSVTPGAGSGQEGSEHKSNKNEPAQPEIGKENNKGEDKGMDPSSDQSKVTSSNVSEDGTALAEVPDLQSTGREGNDDQNRDVKSEQPVLEQNKPFDVVQALDAFTGLDDSTQVAVNSVFGVIENMIEQLQEEKDNKDDMQLQEEKDNKDDMQLQEEKDNKDDMPLQKEDNKDDMQLQEEKDNKDDMQLQEEKDNKDDMQLHEEKDDKDDVNVRDEVESESDDPESIERTNADQSAQETTRYDRSGEKHSVDSIISTGNISGNAERAVDNHRNEVEIGGKAVVNLNNSNMRDIPLHLTKKMPEDYLHNANFSKHLLDEIPETKPLDLDTTTALLVDYVPEDGHWKLLEHPVTVGQLRNDASTSKDVQRKDDVNLHAGMKNMDDFIEPPYVVLDAETQQVPRREYESSGNSNKKAGNVNSKTEELMQLVKNISLDALKVEVFRKSVAELGTMKPDIERDIEFVANAVSLAVGHDKDQIWNSNHRKKTLSGTSKIVGSLDAEKVVEAISSSFSRTAYLRKVIPVGVIVGCSLAALRKYFDIATEPHNDLESYDGNERSLENSPGEIRRIKNDHNPGNGSGVPIMDHERSKTWDNVAVENIDNGSIMVGAVTAALGASAFFGQQSGDEIVETSAEFLKERGTSQMASDKLDGGITEDQNNSVASFAEKAMSVAGPVVPTKGDGEVDQDRLVAMLSGLSQRGGILTLVGKLALLWGGLRGALSLTDRLISFLDMAGRPFYQRILGFVGMTLVLWSPLVIPLLPTLVQGWTTGTPSQFAELVSVLGLYAAILLLIMKWARKIRGYEYPLKQYGLDFTTLPKIQGFFTALAGGVGLVLLMQSIYVCLGSASFSWPASDPSWNLVAYLKVYGQMILLSLRGTITATAVVLVEELLFRSWLPGEIAADLGYHPAIIISGLVFALSQRSPLAVPALWLLSLALSGLRQRSQGSLSTAIGLRAGIMASSFVLQSGGFLTYKYSVDQWFTGVSPSQPFSGVVGLAFALLMAVVLYPRQQLEENKREG